MTRREKEKAERKQRIDARDKQIAADYRRGASLRAVGRRFALSQEGVRQILLRRKVTLRPRGES